MTLAAKSIGCLAALGLLVQSVAAQQLIPPPGASQRGYYIEFGDNTTTPVAQALPTTPAPAMSTQANWMGAVPIPDVDGNCGEDCSECQNVWDGACDSSSCDGPCETPCSNECGLWAHSCSVYASALYLRPRNADVAFAVPIDGPITSSPSNNPLQVAGVGVVDPDYTLGFDVGVNLAVTPMTSIYSELLMLDSSTSSRLGTSAPNVVRSLVSHPSSTSAATDFLSAAAHQGIKLDTFDAGIRHLLVGGQVFAVNYFAAARYSRLEQTFGATFIDNGTEHVRTDIDFDGAGLSLGLEAERQSCHSCWGIYTRGAASFLAGRFRGQYFQGQSFDPTVVDTSWEAGRVVPVLDLELGASWTSPGGCLRLNAGYVVSAWFNTVKTEEFIRSVQNNDFIDLGGNLTFDGLRGQVEWRF